MATHKVRIKTEGNKTTYKTNATTLATMARESLTGSPLPTSWRLLIIYADVDNVSTIPQFVKS